MPWCFVLCSREHARPSQPSHRNIHLAAANKRGQLQLATSSWPPILSDLPSEERRVVGPDYWSNRSAEATNQAAHTLELPIVRV